MAETDSEDFVFAERPKRCFGEAKRVVASSAEEKRAVVGSVEEKRLVAAAVGDFAVDWQPKLSLAAVDTGC